MFMVEDIQTEATIPTEEWWLLHLLTLTLVHLLDSTGKHQTLKEMSAVFVDGRITMLLNTLANVDSSANWFSQLLLC
jgi:hypothetical protein